MYQCLQCLHPTRAENHRNVCILLFTATLGDKYLLGIYIRDLFRVLSHTGGGYKPNTIRAKANTGIPGYKHDQAPGVTGTLTDKYLPPYITAFLLQGFRLICLIGGRGSCCRKSEQRVSRSNICNKFP